MKIHEALDDCFEDNDHENLGVTRCGKAGDFRSSRPELVNCPECLAADRPRRRHRERTVIFVLGVLFCAINYFLFVYCAANG